MVLSWIYEPWVKLTEVKVPGSGKHRVFSFFSKNNSAKCTTALGMMPAKTIQ